MLMLIAAALQISLVSAREWSCLLGRMNQLQERVVRSLSYMPDEQDNETSTMDSTELSDSDSLISKKKEN